MNGPPVTIMFHSVGLASWPWRSAAVSESIGHFEARIAALARAGYTTRFFVDTAPPKPPSRSVALTFDDGYLDNWVHVFPLLKQYSFKATIFVSVDFVDPRPLVRPPVPPGSVSDRHHRPDTCCAGFLSWPEMREMEKSGLVDVQSHCMTHTWYFSGPTIVDFWRPGASTAAGGPVWMLWNACPDLKPCYLTRAAEYESRIPYGTPIYEHGKSLATRRYIPPEKVSGALADHVQKSGGAQFFERPGWKEELLRTAREQGGGEADRYETDAQYLARVRYELAESRRRLEENLGKEVTAVCWPGGGVSEQVLRIARELGYRRFTMPSAWRHRTADPAFADLVPRLPGGGRMIHRQYDCGEMTGSEFRWKIEGFRGSLVQHALWRASLAGRHGWAVVNRRRVQ